MAITYSYDVPDVMCGNCSGTIERALKAAACFQGISLGVDPVEKKLIITLEDESLGYRELRSVINDIIEPVGFVCHERKVANTARPVKRIISHQTQGLIGVGLGMLFWVLALCWVPLPFGLMVLVALSSIVWTLGLGFDSYRLAFKKISKGALTMDSLFAISTLTILIVSSAALFFPGLPMMFEAALLIFGFRHIGLAIDGALRHLGGKVPHFQDTVAPYVHLWSPLGVKRVTLAALKPGDIIQVFTGDKLPVDCELESGEGDIEDCIVTGSMKPHPVVTGERYYAGTNISHTSSWLRFRVIASVEQSHLVRMDTKITRAKLERSNIETTTNRILQYFIPAVVIAACVASLGVGLLISIPMAVQCFVSILVSACPCTLGLITPLAVKIGMKKAADHGIVFNSAKKLEAANDIQCVVFDLNATLTEGTPRVTRFKALPESDLTDE
ncbi:MAG: hypothetical protein B7X00_00120, partial [Legionella sp. 21-45-4]